MNVYVQDNKVFVDPQKSIGKGGEADIFDIGSGKALKLYKPPSHPDYAAEPHEQEGARKRLAEHQTKLREFPTNLPPKVVVPEALATDQGGKKIIGYVMKLLAKPEPLIRYSDKDFRLAGVPSGKVVEDFSDLHQTVDGIHRAGAVIGDFNYLNVLINKEGVFIIDADSFQFGRYLCRMYTAMFVDPLLCDGPNSKLTLSKPHTPESDWYAFAVMLMQCLLFVDPYGGIYRPKNKTKQVPHGLRPLHRITVFDPEVTYPKPAVPYKVLPDDLLQYFHQVFKMDKRETFPPKLLKELQWQTCPQCHSEHARNICPFCAHVAPAAVKEVTRVRGKVTATTIFQTRGIFFLPPCKEANSYGYTTKTVLSNERMVKRYSREILIL
jgi:DNA-binding helix-hairpin-helix protein with protein kinase domain